MVSMRTASNGRVVQDRRGVSRIPLMVPCEIEWSGKARKASLIDISLKGALLSADVVPPPGIVIRLSLQLPHLGVRFETEGHVMKSCGNWKFQHRVGRFAIRLLRTGPEVMALIGMLSRNPAYQ
jgi:hypothetical protein